MIAPSATNMRRISDTRRGLRLSTYQGIVFGLFATCTGGIYFTGFVKLLGGRELAYSLLVAIPFYASAFQIVGAHLSRRLTSRRKAVIVSLILVGAAFLAIAPLPFFFDKTTTLIIALILFAGSQCFQTIHTNLWTVWFSELIPETLRGRYCAFRNLAISAIAMIAGLATGYAIDLCKSHNMEMEGITALFAVGAAISFVSALFFTRIHEPAMRKAPPESSFIENFKTPFRSKKFRRYVFFLTFFLFFNGIGSPIWNPYYLNVLNMSYSLINTYGVVGGVCGLISLSLWGKLSDRYGSKPVLIFTMCFVSIHPLFYLFATSDYLLPVFIDHISSGIMWGGFNIAIFNLLLASMPIVNKEMSLAQHSVITGFALATGAMFSGLLLANIPTVAIFGHDFTNYHIIFFMLSVIRWISIFIALALIVDEGAHTVSSMVWANMQEFKQRVSTFVPVLFRGKE